MQHKGFASNSTMNVLMYQVSLERTLESTPRPLHGASSKTRSAVPAAFACTQFSSITRFQFPSNVVGFMQLSNKCEQDSTLQLRMSGTCNAVPGKRLINQSKEIPEL